MNQKYLTLLRLVFAISDICLLSMCLFVCYSILGKFYSPVNNILFEDILVTILIWFLSTRLYSLYNEYTIIKTRCLYRATWRSVATYLFIFQIYLSLVYHISFFSVFFLFVGLAITSVFVVSRLMHNIFADLLTRYFDTDKAVNVLAIASIGGHWVQLLRLMPLFKSNDVTFISTKQSLRNTVNGHKFYSVPDANRNNKLNLIKCCLSISWVILASKPKIIITTGAAPGLFGIFIGRLLGIKTVWIDSIANVEKLSMSGSIALQIADRVYTQWEHLSSPQVVFAGNILEG